MSHTEETIEKFKEKVAELQAQDPDLNFQSESVEFGFSLNRDNWIYRIADFGNIQKFIESALSSHTERIIAMLEELDKKQFIAVQDNDSHRYQIPKDKKNDWEAWCEIPGDDERSWEAPEYAERIDGMPVRTVTLSDGIQAIKKGEY